MNKNLLIGGAVAALVLMILRAGRLAQTVKNLNVNVSGVDWNRNNKTFIVMLRIINPGNASIRINSVVGDVIFRDIYGAVIDYRNEITIKPGEERTLRLPIRLNLDFVTLLTDILQNRKNALNGKFLIKGSVNAEGLIIPYTYETTVNLTK